MTKQNSQSSGNLFQVCNKKNYEVFAKLDNFDRRVTLKLEVVNIVDTPVNEESSVALKINLNQTDTKITFISNILKKSKKSQIFKRI